MPSHDEPVRLVLGQAVARAHSRDDRLDPLGPPPGLVNLAQPPAVAAPTSSRALGHGEPPRQDPGVGPRLHRSSPVARTGVLDDGAGDDHGSTPIRADCGPRACRMCADYGSARARSQSGTGTGSRVARLTHTWTSSPSATTSSSPVNRWRPRHDVFPVPPTRAGTERK